MWRSVARNSLRLQEVDAAAKIIEEAAGAEDTIFGAVYDDSIGDRIKITVIATGFERTSMPRRVLERQPRTDSRRTESTPYLRDTESVPVHADYQPGEAKSASSQPLINTDDLDVPTFLRNRR